MGVSIGCRWATRAEAGRGLQGGLEAEGGSASLPLPQGAAGSCPVSAGMGSQHRLRHGPSPSPSPAPSADKRTLTQEEVQVLVVVG